MSKANVAYTTTFTSFVVIRIASDACDATAIAVSGTVAGGVLELRGEDSRVISGGSEEVLLTAWSSRRDVAGSMSGTIP
jgi:hypothetical protein